MRMKKRYIVFCVLLSVLAVIISIAMFYFEMSNAHFRKMNQTITTLWTPTSKADNSTGGSIDSDFVVTKIRTVKEAKENTAVGQMPVKDFFYVGKVSVCDGKYKAYGQEVYGSSVVVYGDPRTKENKERDAIKKLDEKTGKEKVEKRDFGFGSRTSIYYKPDNPKMAATYVKTGHYIVFIVLLFLLTIGVVVVSIILNHNLKDDTFDESPVTIMNIPMLVAIVGVLIGFLAGMMIGKWTVGTEYTEINKSIVSEYQNGTRTISVN